MDNLELLIIRRKVMRGIQTYGTYGNTGRIENEDTSKRRLMAKEKVIAKIIRNNVLAMNPVENLPIPPYVRKILIARFKPARY